MKRVMKRGKDRSVNINSIHFFLFQSEDAIEEILQEAVVDLEDERALERDLQKHQKHLTKVNIIIFYYDKTFVVTRSFFN